jgi:DNA repair exonuclease SbcCD ATPase subunit
MKLKELHIRNIASIESADIDFEHGLNDAVTGDPASIFLISGDTGAGKSVILDSISMALYKKTPRIADVANVTKNEFTDTEGESIRVASIEQYTRLGISEKDDSYSEVVFEGNDGKTYHARLTLGIKLGNKDKATGIRPLKHKSPVWEIRVEDGDWTKDSVEQTILQAVGLDFQQFGRMAMLAQGQFANFLTGDKKEREAILEQLTNTQHFTAYGEAIQSLWKKAKDAQSQIQTQYDTEKPHTLSDEQVEQITKELAEAKGLFEKYGKDIEATEGKLKQVEAVLRNEKSLTEASQFKQELEVKMAGEEYKRSKSLFTDWDGTTAQRQQLSDLIKARHDEAKARQDLSQARETFSLLTADMADRQAKAKLQEDAIQQLEEQIGKQAHHEELFTKAGETDLKIGQYLDKIRKSGDLTIKIKQEKDQTEGLKKAEEDAKVLAQDAVKAVNERQDQIDQLSKKRSELNPQAVNDELKKLNLTPCKIPVLKQAALFSCLTGLRISDVLRLKWENLRIGSDGGYVIDYRIKKTGLEDKLPISKEAYELCGEPSTGTVFKGLRYSVIGYTMKEWLEAAGINKHITFHCLRHTFASLQVSMGSSIYTVSKMLGHKNVTTTQIYADLNDANKRKASELISLK